MSTYITRTQPRPAFTLVELPVVIAIIGILVALLLPAVQAAREAARRMQCSNNMRQVGVACHLYHDTYKKFPPGRIVYNGVDSSGNSTRVVTGHLAMVLPFVEQSNLGDSYNQTYGFDDVANQPAVKTPVATFLCPSAPGERKTKIYAGWNLRWTTDVSAIPPLTGIATDYQGVRGLHYVDQARGVKLWDSSAGILNQLGSALRDVTDGSSNTILLFEMAGKPTHWQLGKVAPITNAQFYGYGPWAGNNGIGVFNWMPDASVRACNMCNAYINIDNESSPYSFHPGVVMIMLSDGSTRTISETVDTQIFINLCRKQDGHVVGDY
jgi:prepilin-type N-terminal cleavage/methylation domain-containing protein